MELGILLTSANIQNILTLGEKAIPPHNLPPLPIAHYYGNVIMPCIPLSILLAATRVEKYMS